MAEAKKTSRPSRTKKLPSDLVIPQDQAANPSAYHKRFEMLQQLAADGKISIQQMGQWWNTLLTMYETVVGEPLKEAAASLRGPLETLEDESILRRNEQELFSLQASIKKVKALSESKKKRWLDLIDGVLDAQRFARENAIGTWLYVCRSGEDGSVFIPEKMHVNFFRVWKNRFTMQEAPPGHGKTTCLRGQVLYDIGTRPWLRCLRLSDSEEKARKEVRLLREMLTSGYFQALYPKVRVLGRQDHQEESAKRLTVTRPNKHSREPTMEAAAIMSNVQGNGYDKIYADDIVKPDAANQPSVRERISFKWLNEVETRLRNPAKAEIAMIGTPWHIDDVYGKIEKQVQAGDREKWIIVRYPVKAKQGGGFHLLWPGRYNDQYYQRERSKMTAAEWARLYEMRCQPDEARIVTRLHYYPADESDPMWEMMPSTTRERFKTRLDEIRDGEQWLSVDPSATSGHASSESPITQFALTDRGYAYIRRCWFFPGNPVFQQKWLVSALLGRCAYPDEDKDLWQKYPLPREKADYILVEAQGGIKGQVILWRNFIDRELAKFKSNATGRVFLADTRGASGTNTGKRARLKAVSGYLENGIVKLPGRMVWNRNTQHMEFKQPHDPNISKLVEQIINFPSKKDDGVDTVTQWIRRFEGRIRVDVKEVPTTKIFEHEDSIREKKRQMVKAAMNPTPFNEYAAEAKWLGEMVAV